MTPKEKLKRLRKLAEGKSAYIDAQLLLLEKILDELSPKLADRIAKEFLEKLDVADGVIDTTLSNQNKVAMIEKAFNSFMQKEGAKILIVIADDMGRLSEMNNQYFSDLAGKEINGDRVKSIINNRLGIDDEGKLKRNGFMKGLMDGVEVRRQITDFAIEKITNGTGFNDMRKGMRELIAGNKSKMGKFKQFYRNAAYDTYAKIDAANGKLYADKLNLKYFIYAGTRRKTSRHFCIQRKGKVFTEEEAGEWKDLIGTTTVDESGKVVPAGPILVAEDIPTYNPFIDRGGYGCVDDIMWIGEDVAKHLRPDL